MKIIRFLKNIITVVLGLIMLLGLILVVYPVYWMISSDGSILGYGFAILEILTGLLLLTVTLFLFKIIRKK